MDINQMEKEEINAVLNKVDLAQIYVALMNYKEFALFNRQANRIQKTIDKIEVNMNDNDKSKVFRWGEL